MSEISLDQPRRSVFNHENINLSFDRIVNKEFTPPRVIEAENGPLGFFCHKGLRNFNEDALVINNRINAFASIDGMGGAGNFGDGQKAAAILASEFQKFFQKGWDLDKVRFLANQQMLRNGIKEGGACYLAGKINNGLLDIYQAGDLRLIVINKQGRLNFETQDERLPNGPRNIVTNAVSGESAGKVNRYRTRLDYGDRLIIGSDGLWDNLTTEQVMKIVQKQNITEATPRLNDMALRKMGSELGKKDNINVLIYDYLRPSKPKNILEIENFGELYHHLYQIGPVQGSNRTYDPEGLIKIINLVRSNNAPVNSLTRGQGIREKVKELLWRKN